MKNQADKNFVKFHNFLEAGDKYFAASVSKLATGGNTGAKNYAAAATAQYHAAIETAENFPAPYNAARGNIAATKSRMVHIFEKSI